MRDAIRDISADLRCIVDDLPRDGYMDTAGEIERTFFSAYTSSSEWSGAVGIALLRLRAMDNVRISSETERVVEACLLEVRKVWPTIGRTG